MPKSKHLDWVRSQDCCNCPKRGPSQAHHMSGDFNLSGVGMKAPDWASMPLCSKCHNAFHDADRRLWVDKESRMESQRLWLLSTLIKSIEDGVLVAGDVPGPIW